MKQFFYLLIAGFILISCGEAKVNSPESIDENELGIINASVLSENTNLDGKVSYSDKAPGTSERFERSFENAPPLIPHNTEGFFPITADKNICLSCHMPALAAAVKSIPLPETHFTSLRIQEHKVDGEYVVDDGSTMVKTKTPDQLSAAYYSCNQCHVPQANVTVNIENLFTPEFRDLLNKDRSNLSEKVTEGIQ